MANEDRSYSNAASIVTANQQGRTTTVLNEINEIFAEYASTASLPALDIGCAFGIAALAALERGATVIANDISEAHLKGVLANAPMPHRNRLTTLLGRFPDQMDLEENSLSAVHASNLLNFLSGQEIEAGVHKIWRWLAPGGKVFVISATPYANNIQLFIPTYEHRKATGMRWPGECERLSDYSDHPTIKELPDFLHLLDDEILRRVFEQNGFVIEEARMFHRRHTPDYIRFDGRENVKVIAYKPAT